MLAVVSKHNMQVKTNPFNQTKEIPKAAELANLEKVQGNQVTLIDNEAIENEKMLGLKIV